MALQIASGLYSLPEGLLFGVLVVAALLDLRRGGHKRWVWTGWVGLAATLVVLAAGMGIDASDLPFEGGSGRASPAGSSSSVSAGPVVLPMGRECAYSLH
jgi:hypothetical protein